MAGEFKPGDRVRVTAECETAKLRGMEGEVLHCGETSAYVRLDDWMDALTIGLDRLEPAPTSSPDTPEAGVAGERDTLREEIARHVFGVIWSAVPNGPFHPAYERDADLWLAVADDLLPIIDRHTAKAINQAVMAQDTALETALRERDDARADEREACAEVMDCLSDREDHYAIAGPAADVAIRREREGAFKDAARVIRARASLSSTQEKASG